jgi:Clostripain family
VARKKPRTVDSSAAQTARPRKWTVMVFMGVAHVEHEAAPLSQHADDDVNEMKEVFRDGNSALLNVFVQRHGIGIPTREWIRQGSKAEPVPEGERDAANGNALKSFMISSLKQADHQHQFGDVSVLILWGHAYHFALGHTETPTGIEALDFGELKTVLTDFQKDVAEEFQEEWSTSPSEASTQKLPQLDILAFDACDLAGIEVAHLLSPFACYMVASQIGIPLPGWPYSTILGRLKESLTEPRPMDPAGFGAFAVRRFCEHYQEQDADNNPVPVSLTLLDLSKAPDAFAAAERLAQQMAIAGGIDGGELALTQELFSRSQTIPGRPFIDVADFCLNLSQYSTDAAVKSAAAALGDILIRPSTDGNGDRSRGSFVVEHSRNTHSTARLHGASLYAPQIGDDDWRLSRFSYAKFGSERESSWSRLVHVLAEGV